MFGRRVASKATLRLVVKSHVRTLTRVLKWTKIRDGQGRCFTSYNTSAIES
jgi:hypothetical protein